MTKLKPNANHQEFKKLYNDLSFQTRKRFRKEFFSSFQMNTYQSFQDRLSGRVSVSGEELAFIKNFSTQLKKDATKEGIKSAKRIFKEVKQPQQAVA